MAHSRIKTALSDDVLFFHRPLPSETADLLLYIEDQIAELLFSEETLSDVLYRFSESGDEVLIALARVKTLERSALPPKSTCYRIPAAIDIWLRAKAVLKPGRLSLLFGRHGENAYLLCADALAVRRVYKFAAGETGDRDVVLAIDKVREKYPPGEFPMSFLSRETVSDVLTRELRTRSIESVPMPSAAQLPSETALLEQWDFRLAAEADAQEQSRQKFRVLQAGLVSLAAVAAAWVLLFGAGAFLERLEERYAVRWQRLHGSLREIGYLQKQTGQCICEIMLCRKLSEKRTNLAFLLQQISATRPEQAKLEQLQIGERKKRFDKGSGSVASDEVIVLKGYCADGNRITEWMEQLQKNGAFASVNLSAMEKKAGAFHFMIECTPAAR